MGLELVVLRLLPVLVQINESRCDDQPFGINRLLPFERTPPKSLRFSRRECPTFRTASKPDSGSITRPLAITTSYDSAALLAPLLGDMPAAAPSKTTAAIHFHHPRIDKLHIRPAPLLCGAKSLRADSVCQRFSKPMQLDWRALEEASIRKKNPGSLGGATRGGGTAEGGRRKLVLSSAPGVRPACRSVAVLRT